MSRPRVGSAVPPLKADDHHTNVCAPARARLQRRLETTTDPNQSTIRPVVVSAGPIRALASDRDEARQRSSATPADGFISSL